MSLWHFYFSWYQGAVYSNLVASAICTGLIWWRLRARMIAHHAALAAQAAVHHAERLAVAERHHRELKAHVTAAATRPVARPAKTLIPKPAKEATRMSGIVMFDSVNLSQIPANPPAVGCYVDGRFANSAEAADRFPHAHILTIAVNAAHDAMCLDIETGDATPAQGAAWFLRQKARGITRPCLYASAFVMDTEVIPALKAAGISAAEIRLWSAHYTGTAHICGPSSCRELGVTADGTQWTDRAMGRNLDQSLLAADFFGAPSSPVTDWTDVMIANLPALIQGNTDKAGAVQFIHRMQALVKVIGDINKIPAASAVSASGAFDGATRLGVLAVQAFFGLAQDGVCGEKTWAALVAGQHA